MRVMGLGRKIYLRIRRAQINPRYAVFKYVPLSGRILTDAELAASRAPKLDKPKKPTDVS